MRGPIEGLTRCDCGSKYWDQFYDCGLPASATIQQASQALNLGPIVHRCHSCGEKFRPNDHN